MEHFLKTGDIADWFISHGYNLVSNREIAELLGTSISNAEIRLARIKHKNHWLKLNAEFWYPIPSEYRANGIVPPAEYLNDLMNIGYGTSYYVGWQSAALYYGASNQSPQIFQIAVGKPIKQKNYHGTKLNFKNISRISELPVAQLQIGYNSIEISTPELTVFDIANDLKSAGGLGNAAEIISELAAEQNFQMDVLENLAKIFPRSSVQRLGYIVQNSQSASANQKLMEFLQKQEFPNVSILNPTAPRIGSVAKNWNLLINGSLEPAQ